jgi:hypothetical protein
MKRSITAAQNSFKTCEHQTLLEDFEDYVQKCKKWHDRLYYQVYGLVNRLHRIVMVPVPGIEMHRYVEQVEPCLQNSL